MIEIPHNKPAETFINNITLTFLEYILEEGVDGALDKIADVPEEELDIFPHVKKALEERKSAKNK